MARLASHWHEHAPVTGAEPRMVVELSKSARWVGRLQLPLPPLRGLASKNDRQSRKSCFREASSSLSSTEMETGFSDRCRRPKIHFQPRGKQFLVRLRPNGDHLLPPSFLLIQSLHAPALPVYTKSGLLVIISPFGE